MANPILHGPHYSTYTRTARLTLEEKGQPYELNMVDMLQGQHQQPEHLARNPFGKLPALEHDDFLLYETIAITRYIDELFDGPSLQPDDIRQRARMTQICAVVGSFGYAPMIGDIFMQRAVVPMQGGTADEAVIEQALPQARTAVAALESLANPGGDFLVGNTLTLADLFLIPVYDYLQQIPDGQELTAHAQRLSQWWKKVAVRPSVAATKPEL